MVKNRKGGSERLSIRNKNKFTRGYIMVNEYYKHATWQQQISILYFEIQKTMFSKQPIGPHSN